jgi:two-component system, OmpR family, KDP operon response regulator KdpE
MITTMMNIQSTMDQGVDLDMVTTSHKRITVLIVDDEPETIRMVKTILMAAGMDVVGAENGLDAIDKCPHVQPDVILLDLMMPDMDGYETYEHLQNITTAPVVVVSARALKDDIVVGLQAGMDDYLTKPFYPPELVARINTVVRRARFVPPISIYTFPTISMTIDTDAREVTLREKKIFLPNKEFEILSVLVRKAPKMVSKEEIAMEVWGENNLKIQNRIKYFIHILRGKIELNPSRPKLIISREGLGYRLASDEETANAFVKHAARLGEN